MPIAGQTIKPMVALPKDPADCWPFQGAIKASGHGTKTHMGQIMTAHRWMWAVLFGTIPPGMVVFHTCDRKDCVNPHHLRMGTQADANRGTISTILTPADVAEIRRSKAGKTLHTAAHLAGRYGCSPALVRDIWRGTAWGRAKPNFGPRKQPATPNPPNPCTGD